MARARWHAGGGFCNIDELSEAGMTHLELEMKESIKPTVQVLTLLFSPECSNRSADKTALSKGRWVAEDLNPLYVVCQCFDIQELTQLVNKKDTDRFYWIIFHFIVS